jgi:hypothetical protein
MGIFDGMEEDDFEIPAGSMILTNVRFDSIPLQPGPPSQTPFYLSAA